MNEYENMTKEELLTRCLFLEEVIEERNEQIEKMKCCQNCHNSLYGQRGENGRCEDCGNKDQWELAK